VSRRRLWQLLAVAIAVAALGMPAAAEPVAAATPAAISPATIDLGALFGDENEPDEDEADEGGIETPRHTERGSAVSLPLLLLLAAIGLAAARHWLRRLRRLH
jgi:hypothetical protein